MTIENAILELAKSINFHAETLLEINKPVEIIEQESKSEIIKTPKKSKKVETVISVDPEKPVSDETLESRQTELFEIKVSKDVTLVSDLSKTITSEMCKTLAKEKMAAGVDRTKIKSLITELNAESIADLTEKNLVEFYTKLEKIK
jgi:tetrahydromethanopterin S-methyltransferase subunit A